MTWILQNKKDSEDFRYFDSIDELREWSDTFIPFVEQMEWFIIDPEGQEWYLYG